MRCARGGTLMALAVILTIILSRPWGPLPALLPLLNPAQGIWSGAAGAVPPTSGREQLPGLSAPVQVSYSVGGVPHIFARNDHDLFFSLGYLEARDRLFQMDLMRRQGEGQLAAVLGPGLVATDETELRYGLLVGAQRTLWAMRRTAAGRATLAELKDYADGVNLRIRRDVAEHRLPIYFKLIGYSPAPWRPLDTLAVQEDMEQDLALTLTPLDMAVMVHRLGPALADAIFPQFPPNPQHPYDPGPYPKASLAPVPPVAVGPSAALAAEAILARAAAAKPLFASALQGLDMSNTWVVSGKLTRSGYPMLAGDPHLGLTLPAIWYEFQLRDPHFDVTGVGIPGAPVVLIGHNASAAWSITDTQDQSAFFYLERTSPQHPGRYGFRGRWLPLRRRTYTIAVAGGRTLRYSVDWTNNGPLLSADGQRVAMDWTGQLASPDIQALSGIDRAQTLSQFRAALSVWVSPNQNFAFADRAGEIAIVAPGFYPVVAHGDPALPLDGTGPDEWVGAVPPAAVPQVVRPAQGFAASANQREVARSYPYYIGSAWDFFDPGYRADTIYAYLANPRNRPFTLSAMARLQADNQDRLALLLAPYIARAGDVLHLQGHLARAVAAMRTWPGDMRRNSVQATIYYYFLRNYVRDTFGPWWRKYRVPVRKDPSLRLSADFSPLVEDLEAWTVEHRPTTLFNDPQTGQRRSAAAVAAQALSDALRELRAKLGPAPSGWAWGRVHFRVFPSLTGIAALGRGPYPSGGDFYSPDAAQSSLVATHGPSWRMIVDLGDLGSAVGVYTGGQSENPVSPNYANFLPIWRRYRYLPLAFWQSPQPDAQNTVYEP